MRNLKRALSLALASVMLLGMMVVGTSAASYTDVDSNDNVEAIEVLNAVQVMIGRQGNFEPDEAVNRHEMAVIMAKLYLGSEEADNYVGSHPFTDVVSWADKYVAACYENNLISGTSATTYSGSQPLTAVQAALMMLRALGYEHLTKNAADWRAPVTAQANKIGLFKGVVSSPNAKLTRNDVAQLALNALESDMVEFTGELGWEINGVTVGFQAKWEPRRDLNNHNQGYNYTNDPANSATHQKEYLQLLEDLYDGKLIKDTGDEDDFDRPATTWKYKGKVIGSYMNTPDLTYTAEVKLGDIYKDLGLGKAVAASKVDFSRNGMYESVTDAMTKANNGTALSTLGLTKGDDTNKIGANGVLTQVWWDSGAEVATITMIDTYAGKINTVTKATSSAARYVTVSRMDAIANSLGGDLNNKFETEDFEAKDIVAYTAAWNGSKYDIKTVKLLENPVTGTLTKWNGSTVASTQGQSENNFTVDGETYKYNVNKVIVSDQGVEMPKGIAGFSVNESDIDVYLDEYGYALYVAGVEGETNYAAVIGVGNVNQYGDGANGATLLLADGTIKTAAIKMKSGQSISDLTGSNEVHNKTGATSGWSADIVTYRVLDNGTYELSLPNKTTAKHSAVYADAADEIIFKNGKSEFILDDGANDNTSDANDRVLYTTSKTLFFVATKDGNKGNIAYNVYTGYNAAPGIKATETNFSVAYVTDSYYTTQINAVYLAYDVMDGVSSVDTYFVKKSGADIITTSEGSYYVLPAVINDEVTTIKLDATSTIAGIDWTKNKDASTVGVFAINNVVKDKYDIITSFNLVSFNVPGYAGTVAPNGIVLGVGKSATPESTVAATVSGAEYWAYDAGVVKVYTVDKDYKTIEAVEINDIGTDINDLVYAKIDTDSKKLEDVFVVDVDDKNAGGVDVITIEGLTVDFTTGTQANPGKVTEIKYDSTKFDTTPTQKQIEDQVIAAMEAAGWTHTGKDNGTGSNASMNVLCFEMEGKRPAYVFAYEATTGDNSAKPIEVTTVTKAEDLASALTGASAAAPKEAVVNADMTIDPDTAAANTTIRVAKNATVTLGGDGGAVAGKIVGEGTTKITATVTGGSNIETNIELAASGDLTDVGEVAVKVTGNAAIKGTVSEKATVEVASGKTLTLGSTTLPKFVNSSEGKLNLTGNIAKADASGTDDAKKKNFDALTTALGGDQVEIDASGEGTGTVGRKSVKILMSSTGTLEGYSSTAFSSMGGTSTTASLMKITLKNIPTGATVTGKLYKEAADTNGSAISGDLSAGVAVPSGTLEITMLTGDVVDKLVFTVTPAGGTAYTITYTVQ